MSADSVRLLGVLTSYTHLLVDDYSISDALHDLTDGVCDVLGSSGAGVSLEVEGRLEFAIAHPEAVVSMERVQERHQYGPCVEAHRTGQLVSLVDVRSTGEQWPELAQTAQEVGLAAVVGVPIRFNGTHLGVLNVYDAQPHEWDPADLRVAEVLAAMAAGLVANARRLDHVRTTADQLQRALDSRVIIEQAKGMVAADRNVSLDEAFRLLRSRARSQHATLQSVSKAVVDLRLKL